MRLLGLLIFFLISFEAYAVKYGNPYTREKPIRRNDKNVLLCFKREPAVNLQKLLNIIHDKTASVSEIDWAKSQKSQIMKEHPCGELKVLTHNYVQTLAQEPFPGEENSFALVKTVAVKKDGTGADLYVVTDEDVPDPVLASNSATENGILNNNLRQLTSAYGIVNGGNVSPAVNSILGDGYIVDKIPASYTIDVETGESLEESTIAI